MARVSVACRSRCEREREGRSSIGLAFKAKRIATFELRSLWAIASDVHQRDRLRRSVFVVWLADADMQYA
jgi:hypothetical protein